MTRYLGLGEFIGRERYRAYDLSANRLSKSSLNVSFRSGGEKRI
jgi:hypothetical protein